MLFPNEVRAKQYILQNLGTNNLIIYGNEGIGKRYTVKECIEEFFCDNSKGVYLEIKGEKNYSTKSYQSFESSFDSTKELLHTVPFKLAYGIAEDVPYGNNTLKTLIQLIESFTKSKYSDFNSTENTYISRILNLLKKGNVTLFIHSIEFLDPQSLSLIEKIIKNIALFTRNEHKLRFLIVLNKEDRQFRQEFYPLNCIQYEFPVLTETELSEMLLRNQSGSNTFEPKIVKLLYAISQGNVGTLQHLIDCYDDKDNININSEYNNKSIFPFKEKELRDVIEEEIQKIDGGDGEITLQILDILSILEKGTSNEFTHIINSTKAEIEETLNKANKLNLIEHKNKYYNFAIDIVKKIFEQRVAEVDPNKMYIDTAVGISKITPSDYYRRYKFYQLGKDFENSKIYLILYIIQCYRKGIYIDEAQYNKLLDSVSKDNLGYIKSAIKYIRNNSYDLAQNQLSFIVGWFGIVELNAEVSLLLSLCYSKYPAQDKRREAVNILNDCLQEIKEKGEYDIYIRLLVRKVYANVHIGELEEAKNCLKQLYNLIKKFNEDRNIKELHTTLNRNANAVYNTDIAYFMAKKALCEYSKSLFNDIYLDEPIPYFIALTNFTALATMYGNFEEAYKYAKEGIEFIAKNEPVDFPRKYIIINNYYISGYLLQKFTAKELISSFEDLLENGDFYSDKLFLTSNLSIFYCLNGDVEKAYKLLYNEGVRQNTEADTELIYNYRVVFNCMVYSYIMKDMEKVDYYVNILKNIKLNSIDSIYVSNRNLLMLKLINDGEPLYPDCLSALHKKLPEYNDKPWKYYGLGLVFTSLCNWNEI